MRREVILRPRATAIFLAVISAGLVGVSILLNIVKLALGRDPWGVVQLFRLNAEGNIPAYYSALLILANAALLAAIWSLRDVDLGARWAWLVLSLVFLFLAFDELFEVHESLSDPVRDSLGLPDGFRFAWTVVYVLGAGAVGVAVLPLLRSVSRRVRRHLVIAAALFLGGAVGFELVGGAWYSGTEGDMVYGILYTIEESLEMAGLIVAIMALMEHLSDRFERIVIAAGAGRSATAAASDGTSSSAGRLP